MNEVFYKKLIEQTSFGFARLKAILNSTENTYDFEIVEVNPAFETLTGLSEKQALGAGLNVFFDDSPHEAEQKQLLFKQLLLKNESAEAELFAHKLGRWLRISASPAGKNYIELLFSDITPRKQAEDTFTTAFRLAPNTMTITDAETGNLVEVNDAFLQITGFTREEVIGKSATSLGLWASPSDRDEIIADLSKGREVKVREYPFKNRKGNILYGMVSASIIQVNNKPHILTSIEDITERKKARLALEAEHAKMNAVVAAMPDMIFIMGKDGTIIDIFGAKPELLVAPPEEIIGCSIRTVFPKEEFNRHIAIYENCLRKGTVASIDFELEIKNEKVFFESRVSPLGNDRLLTLVRNSTETRKMQEAVREELSFRNFLFETDRDGLLIMSNDHKVIHANHKICEMLGYSHEELLQLYTWDIDALNNREQILTNFDNSKEVDARLESVHQRKDGSSYDVEVSARSFWWKGERMVVCACRDISDRKILEKENVEAKNLAEANQKRFEEIADYTREFVWEVNAKGIYTYANSAVKHILGYDPHEIVGKRKWTDLLEESEKQALISQIEEIARQNKPIYNLENTLVAKNGRRVHVVTHGIPLTGPNGEQLGYRGSDRDVTKQYEAEEKLKESEKKYRLLVENVSDVLFTLKPDGTISYMSPAVKNLSGFEADDYLGKHFSQFVHKDDLESVAYDFEQLKTGNYYPSEYRINTKNGHEVWVRSSTRALNENSYSGIARDITNEKEAVKALKESEEQYRMLFNANMDSLSIVYIEPDGGVSNFVDMNDAGAAIIGFTKEELLHKSPADIEWGFSSEEVGERIKQLQEKGMAVFETIIRNKNGENRNMEVKAIFINYKNRPAILNISRDITERKQAEIELQQVNRETVFLNKMALKLVNMQADAPIGQETIPEIRQFTNAVFALHTHFDHSQEAFFIKHIDADSKILNGLFKVAGKDILNKPSKLNKEAYKQVAESNINVFSSFHELTFGDIPEVLSKALGAITGVSRIYGLIHVVSGKIYGGTVLGFKENQTAPSNEMLRSYAYMVAITLRRITAEQELVLAKEKAEESNRLKSAFLASISHELRTPLNHVIGFSDLIKNEVSDPEIHKYASIIFNSGTNFLTMIEDILALALSEQSDIKLRMQTFKGMDLFMENRNLLHEVLHNSGKTEDIKLHFKPDAAVLAAHFTSDRLKINQVLTNLFKNAVKYTYNGSITFGIRQDDEETLTFYVADTGIGIAEDKLDIIFEFFRQGDDSHTRLYGGLGIGLALSQRIADIMGARLRVESEEGKGTVFYFSVPVGFIGDMQLTGHMAKQKDTPNLAGKTILLAEDDENSRIVTQAMFRNTDAKLIIVQNGIEAVTQVEQNDEICLVLMDLKMPRMDGFEATRIIKARKPDLPVIALTAFGLSKDKVRAKDAGCDALLTKPVNKSRLFDVVVKYIC